MNFNDFIKFFISYLISKFFLYLRKIKKFKLFNFKEVI